ncbi:hypothetical protein OFB99_24420, partial [Escherichia coli]|nr:hypothetical protein [Escherichia coli]
WEAMVWPCCKRLNEDVSKDCEGRSQVVSWEVVMRRRWGLMDWAQTGENEGKRNIEKRREKGRWGFWDLEGKERGTHSSGAHKTD